MLVRSASLVPSSLFVSDICIPGMYVPFFLSSYIFLIQRLLYILFHAEKKNPFSQRCPHWHLQILMVNNLISAACRWQQPGMWNALHCTWSNGTSTKRSMCHDCTFSVCVGVYVCVGVWGPCLCIHFLPICCAPSMLPQILHPNHNYNVISRIRQCPCCCFTLSFSPLLWISNAVTLSSKSCTSRS